LISDHACRLVALGLQPDLEIELTKLVAQMRGALLELIDLLPAESGDLLAFAVEQRLARLEFADHRRVALAVVGPGPVDGQLRERCTRFDDIAFLDHQLGDDARFGQADQRRADRARQIARHPFAPRVLTPDRHREDQRRDRDRDHGVDPQAQGLRDARFAEESLALRVDGLLAKQRAGHGWEMETGGTRIPERSSMRSNGSRGRHQTAVGSRSRRPVATKGVRFRQRAGFL
jgi:hypothetical protein